MLIDSHCHLDHFDDTEMDAVLDRATAAGVGGLVTIGTRLSAAAANRGLTAHSRPELPIWCTIGTHPDNVASETVPDPVELARLASAPEVVGIGESGLDYLHGDPPVRLLQQHSFRAHIRAARLASVPLVIHAREADEDVATILEEEHGAGGPFAFLLHCFSSGAVLAERALALGGFVSVSGILTFPKSTALRAIVATIPQDRLLVETDAPYLAPVPRRGKRNEPSYVAHTAAVLAGVRGLEPAALARITTANFHRLFTKAGRPCG